MRVELQLQKAKVKFVVVNDVSANSASDQKQLTDRCSFPLLQDRSDVQAWKQHFGGKDDFYIYDSQGKLVHYLPYGGTVDTNLSDQNVYNAIKQMILNVK